MKLLYFVVAAWMCLNSMCLESSSREFASYLKAVVDDDKATGDYTSRIVGPNGYCAQVRDRDYHNGGPVVLQPCDELSASKVTQIWTFGRDGTIKSNGKCLIPYANTHGAYIMIYDCPKPSKYGKLWKFGADGKLVNPTGLVLTAPSGTVGTELILDVDVSSSYQAWVATNNTKPDFVSIVGLNGLCLRMSGSAVWVETCDSLKAGQQWLVYPDGTIRPGKNTRSCLSYDNLSNCRVVVMSCGLNPSKERWLYTKWGAILNLSAYLVMDVRQSKPEMKEIIIHPAYGTPNQKWEMVPLSEKTLDIYAI